jgi:predicted phage tail protein
MLLFQGKPSSPTISFIGGSRTLPDLTVEGPNIIVEWKAPQNNGFDANLAYRVQWRAKTEPEQDWKTSKAINKTEFEIKGLEEGKHEIKVYAVNKAGNGTADMRVVNIDISSGKFGMFNSKTITIHY